MASKLKASKFFHDESFPLAVLRLENHGDLGLHQHEFHELVIIMTGHGRHLTNSESYPIDAGDVFLIRGNMTHGYSQTENMTLVNVLFEPRRLGLPLNLLRDLPGFHALFRVEPRLRNKDLSRERLHLNEEEQTEAAGLLLQLQQELEQRPPGFKFMAFAHLMRLTGFLSRCYAHEPRIQNRMIMRLGKVMSHIEQNYCEPITINRLTRIAAMSESTLSRAFHRMLGRSPIEQVIRVRVLRASELLAQGERVTEAAFACGFNDSNYFSRQFRRIMRQTPRAFRNKHLAAAGALAVESRKTTPVMLRKRPQGSRRLRSAL